FRLAGGVAAWEAENFPLFSGVNVPSKAFGEFVEHARLTPSIGADELEKLMRGGADLVVLDSRPFDEYQRVSIPSAVNVPGAALEGFHADRERTLYLFDVRDPAEYAAGHVAGALSAPGGQLVQATDTYIGTLGARVVLVDEAAVRALMTASWLRQMGFADVFVLAEAGAETGWPATPVLGDAPPAQLRIDCAALAAMLAREEATVVDLSLSRDYRNA